MKKIISVGAHPLDAELMGGPLLIKYAKAGAICTYVHVVQGRLTDKNATAEQNKEYKTKLLTEIETVAKALGGKSLCFNIDSSVMPSEKEFTIQIANYLRKENADLVITHFGGSYHPRHYFTFRCVTDAIKILRKEGYTTKLLYGENCEDLLGFIPQAYYELTKEEFDIWFNGLKNYTIFNGLVNTTPYQSYYSTMGIIRAKEVNSTNYVKAYMYPSMLEGI